MGEKQNLVGQMVGKYRIDRLLGEGGMGQVYLAIHPTLLRKAAVKVLNPEYAQKPEVVQRFFNEARAAAALDHANIVDVYDFDNLPDGRPYMLLEYLEGETLTSLLRREGSLRPATAVSILTSVCGAVGAAHRHGIIHRDLKPDNIFLVNRQGVRGLVKVLDFGIAKLLDEGAATGNQTRGGVVLGTPEYMSPEQALGQNDRIGPPSDVYSTGIIAYQVLAGRPPFAGEGQTFGQLMIAHVQEPPPPLRQIKPDVPQLLEVVVMKALAKSPRERWQSMDALADALNGALDPARAHELEGLLAGGFSSPITRETPLSVRTQGGPTPTTLDASASATQTGAPVAARRSMPIVIGVAATVAVAVIAAAVFGHSKGAPEPTVRVISGAHPTPLAAAKDPAPTPTPAISATPTSAPAVPGLPGVSPNMAQQITAGSAKTAPVMTAKAGTKPPAGTQHAENGHAAPGGHSQKPGGKTTSKTPGKVDTDAPFF